MRWFSFRLLLSVLMFGLPLVPLPVLAGGPLAVSKTGVPFVWDNSNPIPYHPDRGKLGMLSNQEAIDLIQEAFDSWSTSSIPTAGLSFINGGALPKDINTISEFGEYELTDNNGINAIIFDADGSLFEALGFPPGVVGFAGPEFVTESPPFRIVEGLAFFNGAFIDGDLDNGEIPEEEFIAVFRHEFGHFLNLDHTQINGHNFPNFEDPDDPGFIEYGQPPLDSIQLMFPFIVPGGSTEPLSDDIAAISALYPSGSFSSTGTITGSVFESDGATLFQGANVIARNVNDPFFDVVSNISGMRFCGDPAICLGTGTSPPELVGLFELRGLTSGASYTVEIVNVSPEFTGGSAVGPLITPVALCGAEEFYNGANEGSENPPDDPLAFDLIEVNSTVSDINFVINSEGGSASVSPGSHDFGSVTVGETDVQFFLVENVGEGTLLGTATTLEPYAVVSGASYSLGPGEQQEVTVEFGPTTSGNFNGTVTFSCSGGSVTVTGKGTSGPGGEGTIGNPNSGGGSGGGGCFIATAAYGSPLEARVQLLKTFRDKVLLNLPFGSDFVSFYYEVSPPIAERIAKSEVLKFLVRILLLPLMIGAWLMVGTTPWVQGLFFLGWVFTYSRLRRKWRRDTA